MIQKQSDNHLKNPDQITAAATDDHHHQNATTFKSTPSSSTTSSSSWSRFKDPRIVRVSRALGGKDRHSKVCTVRGLRDRRVRLSVPTAIQLYDLQERLGLNQPSKVVDWLLNAAKHDIDELPPLQIPQDFFTTSVDNHNDINLLNFQSDKRGLKIGASASADSVSRFLRVKTKDDEVMSHDRDENTWASAQEETRQFHLENNDHSNQLVLLSNNSSASAINSSYDSFVRLDPSNLTLSHDAPRTNQQHEYWHNFGLLPSAFPFAYHHHQPSATQSYFPSRIGELDFQRSQLSNSTLSSNIESASQHAEQMHFNMTANLLPTQDDNNDGSNR